MDLERVDQRRMCCLISLNAIPRERWVNCVGRQLDDTLAFSRALLRVAQLLVELRQRTGHCANSAGRNAWRGG